MFTTRPERHEDYAAIRDVHERAFAPQGEEAELVDRLRSDGACVADLSLVALTADGAVAGHVCFSRAHLDSGERILVLGPMGVVPELQRRGAGTALVRDALVRAGRTELPLVSVVGHASYYPRFGFQPGADHGIVAPFDVPSDAWMIYRLPAYSSEVRGQVVYASAFGL